MASVPPFGLQSSNRSLLVPHRSWLDVRVSCKSVSRCLALRQPGFDSWPIAFIQPSIRETSACPGLNLAIMTKVLAITFSLLLTACATAADEDPSSSVQDLQAKVEELDSRLSKIQLAQATLALEIADLRSPTSTQPFGPSQMDVNELRSRIEDVESEIGILRTCLNGWLDQIDARFNGVLYTLNFC